MHASCLENVMLIADKGQLSTASISPGCHGYKLLLDVTGSSDNFC
jgi:hypothetical protein